MLEYYLWLIQLMGAANPKTHELLQRYGSAKDVYEAIVTDNDTQYLSPSEIRRLPNASLDNSGRMIELCEKKRIKIITIDDEGYPYRLKNIYNPPVVLFYKGNISGLDNEMCIAGVGARGATEYTAKVTRRTCMDLAKIGVVLVSGMAVGVDHIVHQAAIDVGGRTIGVLACGLDVDYPRGSIPIRERIYELGGACITELLPATTPSRSYFQERNRIISGLSMGVMVFQASTDSGSLITAAHAVQQGRDLFCVPPHDLFSRDYGGVVGLLRDGATPLFNYLDVVNAYYSSFVGMHEKLNEKYTVMPEKRFIFERIPADEKEKAKAPSRTAEKAAVRNERKAPNEKRAGEIAAEQYDFESKDPNYKKVYDFLKENGTQSLESITSTCKISPDDIPMYLLDMEIDGIISSLPGARYCVKE